MQADDSTEAKVVQEVDFDNQLIQGASHSMFHAYRSRYLLELTTCCLTILIGCSSPTTFGTRGNPLAFNHQSADDQESRSEANLPRQLTKARNLENEGNWDKARAIYTDLIAQFPDRPQLYHRLAKLSDRQGRHDEAIQLYSEALRHKPADGEILNDMGYSFFLQGQLEKAESALLKATVANPGNVRYHNNLGLVYGHMRRYDKALDVFNRVGGSADAQFNLAFVLSAQGDFDSAKQCFRKALALDPNHKKARKALETFEFADANPVSDNELAEQPKNNGRWVPYVENSESSSKVHLAGSTAPAEKAVNASLPANRAANNVAAGSLPPNRRNRSLFTRARAVVQENVSGDSRE